MALVDICSDFSEPNVFTMYTPCTMYLTEENSFERIVSNPKLILPTRHTVFSQSFTKFALQCGANQRQIYLDHVYTEAR
jgi:hypothetical protein